MDFNVAVRYVECPQDTAYTNKTDGWIPLWMIRLGKTPRGAYNSGGAQARVRVEARYQVGITFYFRRFSFSLSSLLLY